MSGDFSDGPVIGNPPANAQDRGSIPGPGKFHRASKPMCHNY